MSLFPKIGSGWHNISGWRLIPYGLVVCDKSFKRCIDGFSCNLVLSTLVSIMCWCIIWQNLPHVWGTFCQLQEHILSVVGHFSISPDFTQKIPRGQEERFVHHHHRLYTKWRPYMATVTDFLSCLCTVTYFKALSLQKRSERTLIASLLHNHR